MDPATLRLPYNRPNVTAYPASGTIEQVESPQALARIVDTSSTDHEYDIEFFHHDDVQFDPMSQRWEPIGQAEPYVKWKIKNPSGNANVLEVSEYFGTTLGRRFTYTYDTGTSKWSMAVADGLRTVVTWKTVNGAVSDRYREVKSGSQTVWRQRRTYAQINGWDVLTAVVDGDGSVTRTTTYTPYYTAYLSDADIGRTKRVDYPDGRWEMFEYDSHGRITKHYESYLDMAAPAGGDFPAFGTGKVTEYSYSGEAPYDTGQRPDLARRVTVKVPVDMGSYWELAAVSCTLRSVPSYHEVQEQTCPIPDEAAWDSEANLKSTTTYYPDTTGPRLGRVKARIHQDGTATTFDYLEDANGFTEIEATGEPDPQEQEPTILNGTHTETEYDTLGRVLSRVSKLIANGQSPSTVLASQTYYYDSADPLLRNYHVVDLANRTNKFNFDCCTLESTINPDGAQTSYVYDDIKRQVGTIQYFGGGSGIKTTNLLDAAGRVLLTKRVPSSGTDIIMLGQYAYDVVGRLIRHTNALNGVTTNLYEVNSGALREITLHPDGGTQTNDYYLDGRLKKVTGTAVSPALYEYGVEEQTGEGETWSTLRREYTKVTKLDSNWGTTSEWTKTLTDAVGRSYKTVYPDSADEQSWFNSKGQLEKQRDADGVITLYEYNGKGELVATAADLDQDGIIDRGAAGSKDRVRDRTGTVTTYSSANVFQTADSVLTTDGSSASALVSVSRTTVEGLTNWVSRYKDQSTPVTMTMITKYGLNGYRTNTVTYPDGSTNLSLYSYGRLLSVTRKEYSTGNLVTKTTYAYDNHGRLQSLTDARNGATTYTYADSDQVLTVTTPVPPGQSVGQTTTTFYDKALRAWRIVQPDGTSVTNEYFPNGLLKWTYGSRTYPVQYAYDAQGRMTSMKTYQSFSGNPASPGTAAETTWAFDSQRGWLVKKIHPGETDSTADYTYTAGGKLKTRVWERGVTTTYKYGFDQDPPTDNEHGDLVEVSYSGGTATPTVSYSYDRRGRRSSVSRNSITTSLTYNDADETLTESYSGGTLANLSVNNVYDNALRRTTIEIKDGSTVLQGAGYAYDYAGRLQTVTDASASSYTATYGYHANSMLVTNIVFKQSATVRMLTTKQYDVLNRLTSIGSKAYGSGAPALPVSFSYGDNSANQHTSITNADGSYWVYTYDALGQVTTGKKYWGDGTLVAGQNFEYTFDHIGNRDTSGGRASAQGDYTVNPANQYTSRTVPNTVDVLGLANPTANVTVKVAGGTTYTAARYGEYYHHALNVGNNVYPTLEAKSLYGTTETQSGEVFNPPATESYGYDDDGNLTSDGRWTYTWDGENRLVEMKRDTSTPTLSSRMKITFEYDHQGRRIRKTYFTHTGSAWVEQNDTIFLYDGWNVLGELNANSSNAKLRTYVWGLDLSGSPQGAGGVGGLLKVTDHVGSTTHHFVACDGNGNVAALFDGSTGAVTARYEYGPFGEALRATGPMARKNPFRFSTKYTDEESGLLYYGYRFYNPTTGRWLSRDPIAESGGANLFAFVGNQPIQRVDLNGQSLVGDVFSLLPIIGTVYNARVTPAGAKVSDYTVSLTGCDLDKQAAQDRCRKKIGIQQAKYVAGYVALNLAHEVIDGFAMVATTSTVLGPIIFGVDAAVDLAISGYKIGKINDAAAAAAAQCVCPCTDPNDT